MGCGCGGKKAAEAAKKWKIQWRDGTTDAKEYSTEVEAQMVIRRSGRLGSPVAA